jgi:hypothetical protein
MRILEILNVLKNNNSRLHKEAVLKEHQDNELLKKVIFLALDPLTQFYIRKIPKYVADFESEITLDAALDSLQKLSTRQITGNAAINYLKLVLCDLHHYDAQVLERVIAKDLKCGVAAATVNKIWPGLIPEYPCMLCEPFTQKLINKFSWPAAVQLKADGMRFNAIVRNKQVEFRSRNGKLIDLLGELERDFIDCAASNPIFSDGVVFDGELLVYSASGNIMDRKTGNGILNKAVKGTIGSAEASWVHASLWDVIDYNSMQTGKYPIPYGTRFDWLKNMELSDRLHIIESYNVSNLDIAMDFFNGWLKNGQEGAILKDLTAPWEDKRSQRCLKLKNESSCDLLCVGYKYGTGKNASILGALELQSADHILEVGVGTGFTDNDRQSLTPENTVGKIVAVNYNSVITNKQGGMSLFLPVFVEIREDKDVADHSKDIK